LEGAESHLSLRVIDEDVERFHISMNSSSRMTEIESFEEFVDVVAYVSVGELRVV